MIAVFDKATGALQTLAPSLAVYGPLPATMQSVTVVAGYDPDTFLWSASARQMVESLAGVKAQLVAAVKLTNENYVRALYTTNFGKQKKYSRKQQEVMDFRGLAPVTTSLTAALTAGLAGLLPAFNSLGVAAQRKKFRFAMAEAALRGVSIDTVIARFEARIEIVEQQVAAYEAIEQVAVETISAATSIAAARAAYAAINWAWTPGS